MVWKGFHIFLLLRWAILCMIKCLKDKFRIIYNIESYFFYVIYTK